MKKVSDILPYFLNELSDLYPENELKSIMYISINSHLGLTKSGTILQSERILEDEEISVFINVVNRLQNMEPIQYILSETKFFGLSFHTKKGILIPRPETEELVDWIIKDNKNSEKRYLDIGTGSGCIIISLAKNLKGIFDAIDVSEKSIRIADKNSIKNKVNINMKQTDILCSELEGGWDVIVSNPPYVLNSEKELMNDMLETMYAANGIGLAAIQIGEPKRIIVMDLSKKEGEKEPLYFLIFVLDLY